MVTVPSVPGFTYGRQRAEERGLRGGDVERVDHESRRVSRKAVKR